MKVLLNSQVSRIIAGQNHYQEKLQTEEKNKAEYKQVTLPNFQQVDTNLKQYNLKNLSFKGITNEKLLLEIKNLEKEKESLLSQKFDNIVEVARTKLKQYKDWYDSGSDNYSAKVQSRAISRAKEEGSAAKARYTAGHGGAWMFFHGDGTRQYNEKYNEVMDDMYYSKSREIYDISNKEGMYESIVRNADANQEQKKKRIIDIDALIETKNKLIKFGELQEDIDKMISTKGGINDRIAGYQDVKDALNVKFVQPLVKSISHPETEVPSAVLLYGPTGTGKTTFLNGIMDQTKDYSEIVDMSDIDDHGLFQKMIGTIITQAKGRYINENKRTIVLLNDAEKILSVSKNEAAILGVSLDAMDESMIEKYGSNHNTIAYFKQLLDTVSKPPEKMANGEYNTFDNRSGITFFITTNYPHLIHPDLLTREGKMTKIPVGLANTNDLAAVVRFYFTKMGELSAKLKALKSSPDYESYIDSVAGISEKGKNNLKQAIKNDTIDKLGVPYEYIPYKQLAENIRIDMQKGAYSNDCIRYIAQESYIKYLESNFKESDYRDFFFHKLINTQRDINPARIKKFNLIKNMIQPKQISSDTLDELLKQEKAGILSEKSKILLEYKIDTIQRRFKDLNEIQENRSLDEIERQLLKELEEQNKVIEETRKPKVEIGDESDFE